MEQTQTREVARVEYFSGANEPTITIRKHMVRLSAHCLNELPGVDYVQFVMYPREKRLVIEPCSSEERDAIRWSSRNPDKRKPKIITCKEYYRKLRVLMGWDEDCRYTILGKKSNDGDTDVIAFDLTSAMVYRPNAEGKLSRTPEYPEEWGDGFGMSIEDHKNNPLVKRFPEDTELNLGLTHDSNVQATQNSETGK